MRRTTPLTVAGLLCLALLAPTASASAAGETCRGEAATIVGGGPDIRGTEGRDVIVTGGSTSVSALGGDDLICVAPVDTRSNVIDVDAGAGSDLVDTTGASDGYYVDTELGAGPDTLVGGPGGDWVTTGDPTGNTAEVDVVRTGAGGDNVTTSGGADVVDLGPHTDRLTLDGAGVAPGGSITGGDDHDTFATTVATPTEHVFDLVAGTYRTAGASADLVSFEGLDIGTRGSQVRIAGTAGNDRVNVEAEGPAPSAVVVDLLGGDDVLSFYDTQLGAGTRLDLGEGDDEVVAARERGSLGLDLAKDEMRVADLAFPASGVEDANLIARRVTLTGDAPDNTLIAYACDTTMSGGDGNDELIWDEDYFFESYTFDCTSTSATMRGGPGRDSFHGSRGKDRLVGGSGNDTIRGDMGADRIRGGTGADRVEGGRGKDDVRGGSGADTLLGEEGADVLIGERGRDLSNGGTGRDRCVAERRRMCER